AVGLEAAYNVLLEDTRNSFSKENLQLDLARRVAYEGGHRSARPGVSNYPNNTIAAGFLEHIGAAQRCSGDQYLPCFLPFKE
ncbi:hypothetical protein FO519_010094, partial [Halicephalobus sp. NKZ332]